jgi:hypothetical protein
MVQALHHVNKYSPTILQTAGNKQIFFHYPVEMHHARPCLLRASAAIRQPVLPA